MAKIRIFLLLLLSGLIISPALATTSDYTEKAEKATPTDVYQNVAMMNLYADQLLKQKHIKAWQPPKVKENNIKLVYVYQALIAANQILHDYELSQAYRPTPIIIAAPMKYYPSDSYIVSKIIRQHMKKVLELKKLPVPVAKLPSSGMTSEDVFNAIMEYIAKMSSLTGMKSISPNEVYEQMQRGSRDLLGILQQLSNRPELNKDQKLMLVDAVVNSNKSLNSKEYYKAGRKPKDVYEQCLKIREQLNKILHMLNQPSSTVPKTPKGEVNPVDVYMQSQIIIAEMNRMKGPLQLNTSTPATLQAQNKTPTDVYRQTMVIENMLTGLQKFLSSVGAQHLSKSS